MSVNVEVVAKDGHWTGQYKGADIVLRNGGWIVAAEIPARGLGRSDLLLSLTPAGGFQSTYINDIVVWSR